jgi:hypothetical protein
MLAHPAIAVHDGPAAAISCRAALPRGPRVPAPIVLRNACGGFRLGADGRVTRLRVSFFAATGSTRGTGRRYGADLSVRRNPAGRFFVLRGSRVVWRSSGSYRNDGTQIAFGPHSFAFATFRGGVYRTDLHGPERLVLRGRSLAPLGVSSAGDLTVEGRSRIRVVSSTGALVRSYGYRTRNGVAFDERTESLSFVTPDGHLATGPPRSVRSHKRLPAVEGVITLTRTRLLVFSGGHELVVTRPDGTVVARAAWHPAAGTTDSGFELSPDGRALAFRISTAHPGDTSGTAVVYVVRAGESAARVVFRDRLGPVGCGSAATMSWHGDDLLYGRSGGELAAIDTRTARIVELSAVVHELGPGSTGVSAGWQA